MYFMLSDVVMLVQFIYYAALQKRNAKIRMMHARKRKRREREHGSHASSSFDSSTVSDFGPLASPESHAHFSHSFPSMPMISESMMEEAEVEQPPFPPDPPDPPPPSSHPWSCPDESALSDTTYEVKQDVELINGFTSTSEEMEARCPSPPLSNASPPPSYFASSSAALGLFGAAFALSLVLSQPFIANSRDSISPFGIGLHGWGAWDFHLSPSYSSADKPSSLLLTWTAQDTNVSMLKTPLFDFNSWCSSGGQRPSDDYSYDPSPPPPPFPDPSLPWYCDIDKVRQLAGTGLGYGATLLYLGSRISQIIQTWSRGSAEGLSLLMFCLTVSANLLTGCSILLRVKDSEQLKEQLPWVAGALGTVGLDVTLTLQALHYQRLSCQAEEPLLVPLLNEINVS